MTIFAKADTSERFSRLQPPHESVLDLIGETPMVELRNFDTGKCRLFVKLESQNPGGSIKDRIALSMILDAERRGVLKPGSTIVEATAGNTGLGLAQVGIPKGYRIVLVVPDARIAHLLLTAGLLVLMATPVARVAVSVTEFARGREWWFVLYTVVVLVLLLGSIMVAILG